MANLKTQKYITRVLTRRKLHKKSLAYKIPSKTLFLTTDVETTGLDYMRDDEIHECAIRASDERFKQLAILHIKSKIHDSLKPEFFVARARKRLFNLFEQDQNYEKKFFKKTIKRFALFKGLKLPDGRIIKGIEKSYTHCIYNIIEEHCVETGWSKGDIRLSQIRRSLRDLVNAYDIHWVLKLTKYRENDPERLPSENLLAKNVLSFIRHTLDTNSGKRNIVLVGQNISYDLKMTMEAMMKANISYSLFMELQKLRYVDTAITMRKHINKYIYCTFLYFYRKWKESGTNVLRRKKMLIPVLLKLEPVAKNRLGYLSDYFHIVNESWHTASNDIVVTDNILLMQLAVDLRFREWCDRNPKIKEILNEVENKKSKTEPKISKGNIKKLYSIIDGFKEKINDDELIKKSLTEINLIVDKINDKKDKKKYVEYDFSNKSNDPYRKEHIQLFNKFISEIGLDINDFKINQVKDEKDNYEEYERKIKAEFPGATEGITLSKEWAERALL